MAPCLHAQLPPDAWVPVLTATSSKWDLAEQSGARSGPAELQASYSRCAHRLHALLMSAFKLCAISLSFNSGTGGVEGLLLYLMADKGAAVPLYHWRAPCQSAFTSLFPLPRQVHGAENMRAKCFSQTSSTFGCACLVCFYGIKERSHERGQAVHHWPGGSGLQESSRGLITQPAAGAGLSERGRDRGQLCSQ